MEKDGKGRGEEEGVKKGVADEKGKETQYCEGGENKRNCRGDGGMDVVGRLEEGLDRRRERGQKKGRDIVTVGGGGFRVRPPSTASWNKQTVVRQTVLFLMGEKLAVPWMFPCTFHFLNAVLSVHHLTSHQCLRKEPRFICCCT